MNQVMIWDLDGVLANTDHRMDLSSDPVTFYETLEQDPAEPVARLLMQAVYRQGHIENYILTGRPEMVRGRTTMWLRLGDFPYKTLIMRPDGDTGNVQDFKINAIQTIQRHSAVRGVIEDNPVTADRIRTELGLPVLLVDSGHYTAFGQNPAEDRWGAAEL